MNQTSSADEIYNELISPIRERMIRTVRSILASPDDASDALQNVLMGVWQNLPRIHGHPAPQAYILRMCINESYELLRRRQREQQREDLLKSGYLAELPGSSLARPADAALVQPEKHAAIAAAVFTLPPQQRETVLMRVLHQESFAEIARVLGCTEATARSHFSKGLAGLRQRLVTSGPQERSHP